MSTTLTIIHDKALDAIGATPVSAGIVAARCEMAVKEAVNVLYDLREAGKVERIVQDSSALAEWRRI
jgi:predicted Rossmann fold nucleotide-binding protein DprA/Smf involved in DNA uptake